MTCRRWIVPRAVWAGGASRWIERLLLTIGVIAPFGVPAAHADPLAPAEASVWVQAARTSYGNQEWIGPLPVPLSNKTSDSDSWTNPDNTTSYWVANGDGDVSFTGGEIGTITANASVTASGQYAYAHAGGAGTIQANFRVAPISAAPFLSAIPVTFQSIGVGSISGSTAGLGGSGSNGAVSVSAHVLGVLGFPYNDFQFTYEGESFSGFFSPVAEFSVTAGAPYTVLMAATADAFATASALPGDTGPYFSTVTASVDPIIGLDQAAFDRLYGSEAFRLSDYYAIEVSPNLFQASVPEPGSWVLLASGLCAIGLLRLRARKIEAGGNVTLGKNRPILARIGRF